MRTKRLLALTSFILLAVATSVTHSKGFSYTYGQIGYQNVSSDRIDYEGISADISYGALDFMHIRMGYSRYWVGNLDGTRNDSIDIDAFRLGGGLNFSVHDKVDLVGRGHWIYHGLSGDRNNADIGYDVEAGARVQLLKNLELTPSVYYYDNDDFEADMGYGLGLKYKLHKRYSFRIRTRFFDDDEVKDIFAGVRYDF